MHAAVAPATGIITTIAGGGTGAIGGPAVGAALGDPQAVALDGSGDVFYTDIYAGVVNEVVASTGIITTVAGTGVRGYSGDGGPATAAQLYSPQGVTVDSAGNLYISDTGNNVVRRVDAATHIITTYAGFAYTGNCPGFSCESGDGGPATQARLYYPIGLVTDSAGNLYISDSNNAVVREVNAQTGIITAIAGGGSCGSPTCGDGGPATQAELYTPTGLALRNGTLYIADQYGDDVRAVTLSTGVITSIAAMGTQSYGSCGHGSGTAGYSGDGGPSLQAQLSCPEAVAVDSGGNVFIADTSNSVVREVISGTRTIVTVAGGGTGGDGSLATQASLCSASVYGVAVDAADNLYIDGNCNHVWVVGHPGGSWPTTPGRGVIAWHPHHTVPFASGLTAGVDLSDGHLTLTADGISLSGRRMGLAFNRTYDSASAAAQPSGSPGPPPGGTTGPPLGEINGPGWITTLRRLAAIALTHTCH